MDRFTFFCANSVCLALFFFFVVVLLFSIISSFKYVEHSLRREIRNFDLLEQKELKNCCKIQSGALFFTKKGEWLFYLKKIYHENKTIFFFENLKVVRFQNFKTNSKFNTEALDLESWWNILKKKKKKLEVNWITYSSIGWCINSSVGAFS